MYLWFIRRCQYAKACDREAIKWCCKLWRSSVFRRGRSANTCSCRQKPFALERHQVARAGGDYHAAGHRMTTRHVTPCGRRRLLPHRMLLCWHDWRTRTRTALPRTRARARVLPACSICMAVHGDIPSGWQEAVVADNGLAPGSTRECCRSLSTGPFGAYRGNQDGVMNGRFGGCSMVICGGIISVNEHDHARRPGLYRHDSGRLLAYIALDIAKKLLSLPVLCNKMRRISTCRPGSPNAAG